MFGFAITVDKMLNPLQTPKTDPKPPKSHTEHHRSGPKHARVLSL